MTTKTDQMILDEMAAERDAAACRAELERLTRARIAELSPDDLAEFHRRQRALSKRCGLIWMGLGLSVAGIVTMAVGFGVMESRFFDLLMWLGLTAATTGASVVAVVTS
jgi:hypothetical protein